MGANPLFRMKGLQGEMTLPRIVIATLTFCLSMIFSENRYTLFRIMLVAGGAIIRRA
jgi:hypothetical protein